jgi:outer membrane protein TolC
MYICLLIAFLYPLTLQPAALTLDRARIQGLAEKPSLKASAQNIAVSEYNESHEYSKLLPQLTVSHASFLSKELSLDATQHTITLQGSQLIFNAAGPQLQGRIAALSTQQATYQHKVQCNELRYALATQFLQTFLLQEKNTLMIALQKYTLIYACTTQRQYAQGISNILASLAAQTTIAENNAAITEYNNAKKSSQSLLAHLMGTSKSSRLSRTKLSFSLTKPIPPLQSVSYYIECALQHRPELQEKKVSRDQYALIARSHRLSYLPTISTQAALSKTFAGALTEQGATTSLGLTLQWNFFDGFQRVHAAHAADAQKLRTSFEQQELQSLITHQITQTHATITALQRTLKAAQAGHKEQLIRVKNVQLMLSLGTLSPVDYAKQIVTYCESAHAVKTKIIALHTQWQTLAYYCGYPPTGVLNEL